MTNDRRLKTIPKRGIAATIFLFTVICDLSSAYAATPSNIHATYEIYKSGIMIGQIDELYTRKDDHYSVTSTTRPVGLLAVFKPGKIIISSNGLVGPNGLQPLHFSDRRVGDEDRDRSAEFDWDAKRLTLIHQQERRVMPLPDDTQDRLSAMYQFMFLPLTKADTLSFHMTNGGKLDIYNYRITPDQSVAVPFGTFKALYVASVPEADASRTEIWLAEEHADFPFKMVITDRDGGQFTQVLTGFDSVP